MGFSCRAGAADAPQPAAAAAERTNECTNERASERARGAERAANEVEYESFSNDIWRSVFDGRTVVPEPAYGGLNLFGFDASSAWVFSAVDLARLAAATDGDEAYPDILRPETVKLMTTSGTPPGETPVGAAWFLETDGSGSVIGWNHSGGMPGTISLLVRLPSGIIVSVITNTAREQAFTDELFNGLIDAVGGVTDWPTADLFPQYQ